MLQSAADYRTIFSECDEESVTDRGQILATEPAHKRLGNAQRLGTNCVTTEERAKQNNPSRIINSIPLLFHNNEPKF